ncbi:MAG: substrate-binding domain-containing protein [Pseudomonadota bacterium]
MGETLSIGLLLPQRGPIGMWRLSCENCVNLAIAELNAAGGVLGRELSYQLIDASGPAYQVADSVSREIEHSRIDALVGMHTSDIRVAIAKHIKPDVPYIYTPLYEGGETDKSIFMVGQTPEHQTKPMISWLASQLGAKRWFLIGNDYNYPYVSNQCAKEFIKKDNGHVVGERYVSADADDFSDILSEIASKEPDAVFVNLIGCSNVRFNRQFGQSELPRRIIRFCAVLEENTVLGIGAENTDGIFTSTSYMRNTADNNANVLERLYTQYFGPTAPMLNQFAASCYEGIHLLSTLAQQANSISIKALAGLNQDTVALHGPRGELELRDNHLIAKTHAVHLRGIDMEYIKSF